MKASLASSILPILALAPSEAWVQTIPSPPPVATGSALSIEVQIGEKLASTRTATASAPISMLSSNILIWLQDTVGVPPALAAETGPPTKEEVNLLRQAFASFYGTGRDFEVALDLLTKTITAWERQAPDEQAGLFRVRGDCYMALLQANNAVADYTKAISLIQGPGGEKADPSELPAAFLGRARAIRSLHTTATQEQAKMAVQDYEKALKLSAREEWDTEQELLEDGARTNPYATWEYGMALRLVGDYAKASSIHTLASDYFDDIGDRARSVISAMDAGIDQASSDPKSALEESSKKMLQEAIQRTKTVEGRDIPLLQRVIAKEGEARMALASISWTTGDRPEAERQLGLACERLDQLEADAIARNKINPPPKLPPRLTFNIDDGIGAFDISCSRLRNKDYLTERLEWPTSLQQKVGKLYSLTK